MSLLLFCRFGAAFLTTPRDVVEAKAGVQMQSTRVKYKVCSLWEHLSQLGMLPPPLLCPGCVFGWAVALRGHSWDSGSQRSLCCKVRCPVLCSFHFDVLYCLDCDLVIPPLLVAAPAASWIPPFPCDLHACSPQVAALRALLNSSPKNTCPVPRVPVMSLRFLWPFFLSLCGYGLSCLL